MTAQGRLSGLVLTALPFIVGGVHVHVQSRRTSADGRAARRATTCSLYVLVSLLVGHFMIRRIVRIRCERDVMDADPQPSLTFTIIVGIVLSGYYLLTAESAGRAAPARHACRESGAPRGAPRAAPRRLGSCRRVLDRARAATASAATTASLPELLTIAGYPRRQRRAARSSALRTLLSVGPALASWCLRVARGRAARHARSSSRSAIWVFGHFLVNDAAPARAPACASRRDRQRRCPTASTSWSSASRRASA